ncbi:methyl-accepting chemotaxis protein [Halovivax sp.]|uniref:methyl-accepting chemotaxis protein n=1 Tax=Halovivax sp. TaxID=1935978 RepID=UPI0025C1BEDE|nr:methyl-accepting chemotaxis protein [Halovivax sp.]
MNFLRRLVPAVVRRRYALKFGIALLVLGLSVGAIGFVATAGITDEVEQRVQDDHASFATQEAQSLEMWNARNEQTIAMIASSDSVDADDVGAIEFRFLHWQEHLDADIFRMDYVDTANETVLTSTQGDFRPAGGEEVPSAELGLEDDAFEAAAQNVEGVPWVSKPYITTDAHGQEAAVVTYVLDVPREDDRAIVFTADLEAYATNFQDTDRVTTLVLDGDDDVMLDSAGYGDEFATFGEPYGDEHGLTAHSREVGPGVERISEEPAGALGHDAYEFDTDDYVAGYASVHGTDWVVLVHEPTDDAYGFVTAVDQYGTAATLLGILMIGMVGAVLGRNTAVSIDRLTDKAARMEDGDLDVEFETERIDNIGRLYDGFGSMRDALRAQIDEAQAAREEAEAERERVQRLNEDLERAANQYSRVMEDAAEGDLTSRMDAEATENETMRAIAGDFNEMLAEIEETVAELNRFATEVATASEEVTASSEEVRSASQQVTGSIQEISDGAERQNESLQSVDAEMSSLSTTTEQIAASSNEVADIAERTVDTGREGRSAAREAIDAMDEIEDDSGTAVDEIRRLEAEVQQIDELIHSISQIAKQTNMLALNANIEASRSSAADEEGEGFAVVAQEVKELSEDVKEAADEAEERLESIREQTTDSAEEVERTSDKIDDAGEQVQAAVDALEAIAEYAQETNQGVQEISAATEEQAASTQEVVAMVDDAATISEETTAEAETVAAAAEEQTTALTAVSNSASELAEGAAELSEALDRFETDAAPAATEVGYDEAAVEGDATTESAITTRIGESDDEGDATTESAITTRIGESDDEGPNGGEPSIVDAVEDESDDSAPDAGRDEEDSTSAEDDVFEFGDGTEEMD